ncbi:MAG TPA: DUF222 domain-containing protein [Acidimicrobiales bacterium]|nr:DUF222 domain-containing protein [Acidimicrobiales bacterium]
MDAGALRDSTTAELVDTIDQLDALMTATHAQLLQVVAEYDRREAFKEDGATSMTEWLVARLGIAHRTGKEWARVARSLEQLPAFDAAFSDARLSFDQLAPATKLASPETEAAVVDQATGCTAAQLETAVRRARPVPTKDANEGHRRRYLRLRWDRHDRFLRISGRLADAEGAVVERAISALAQAAPPDPVSGIYDDFESRCADALVELASARLAPEAEADKASVVIHTDPSVLGGAEGWAEIEDGPSISAETARRLACDSRWQLVAEDGAGQALGLGRRTRQTPRWLARQLRRRDDGCRFPGCSRKRWLHSHHIRHWPKGGPTDPDNLVSLCRHHHRLVHEGGWRIEGRPDGELRFVHPLGRALTTRPEPLRAEVRERLLV